jgi:hypothetical protein
LWQPILIIGGDRHTAEFLFPNYHLQTLDSLEFTPFKGSINGTPHPSRTNLFYCILASPA